MEEFVQEETNCNEDVELKYDAETSKLMCATFGVGLRQVFVLPVTCPGNATIVLDIDVIM